MFQDETTPSPLPLTSALFLLPFLGVFELGMILYSPGSTLPILGEILIPGMFSCILLLVLGLQQICDTPKLIHFNNKELGRQQPNLLWLTRHCLVQQWKESCWFGLTPALLVITIGLIASSLFSDAAVAPQATDHPLQSLPSLSVVANQAGSENASGLTGKFSHIIFMALQAGLLEEFVFRILLLTGIIGLLLGFKVSRRSSLILSIVLSSGLFALAHDTSLLGDFLGTITPGALGLFLYRFCAGTYLAMITLSRGFGVAAGTHIFYNLLIGACL